MPEIIIKTRVSPPKLLNSILSRQRLLDLFSESSDKSIILLVAPAGYGKTTLVQDFLIRNNKKFCWYHASEDVTSVYSFFSYLISSIAMQFKEFGKSTLELIDSIKGQQSLSSDTKSICNALTTSLINELCNIDDELYITIDDLHYISDNKWLVPIFNGLIENLPGNIHLIITSRDEPEFNLTKVSAKRKLLKITKKELTFEEDETANLIKEIYKLPLNKGEARELEKKVNGWITGIHLILQAYGASFEKAGLEKDSLPENIFDFFANDIFSNLPEDAQEFLLNTSILDDFTISLCNFILGHDKSDIIIQKLIGKNIFIERTAGENEETFNYHSLFRKFLTEKFYAEKTRDEINKVLLKAFEHYNSHGNKIKAIGYLLEAEDYTNAILEISLLYEQLLSKQNYEILLSWLDKIPDEILNKTAFLLYLKAHVSRQLNLDLQKSYAYACKAIELADDIQLKINSCIEKVEAEILLGKIDEALLTIEQAMKINDNERNKAKLLEYLSMVNYRRGFDYEKIIKNLNEALEICENNDIADIKEKIYLQLGNVYNSMGDNIKCLFYYEHGLKKTSNIYNKMACLSNLIQVYSYSGKYEKGREYLLQMQSLFKQYKTPYFERLLMRTTAWFLFESGDYEEAIETFKKLSEFEIKSNIRFFNFIYYLLVSEAYFLMNKFRTSKDTLLLASEYIDSKDEYLKLEFELQKAYREKETAVNDEIEKVILTSLNYYEKHNIIRSRVNVELHLADFYFKKSLPESCISYLSRCLKVSNEKQYLSFLEQYYPLYIHLFDLALANNIEKDFIRNIRISSADKANIQWFSDEAKERLKHDVKKIYDIYLMTFGGADLFVRGTEIKEDQWIRKKSKFILLYLLLNPGVRLSKDKILDIFFSELNPESAESVFHQALTNIRNVLQPGKAKEETKKSKSKKEKSASADGKLVFSVQPVIYEDKLLKMNPDLFCYTDVQEFDNYYNKSRSAEYDKDERIYFAKKAVELYKGEFLTGLYEQWCEDLRQDYINKFISLCEDLIEKLHERNLYNEVIYYSEKLLSADRMNEEAYIYLMNAYKQLNNINMAKTKFSAMLKIYKDEFGETPSKSSMDRISEILS